MNVFLAPKAWEQTRRLGLTSADIVGAVTSGSSAGVWIDDEVERLYVTVRRMDLTLIVIHQPHALWVVSVRD